MENGDGSEEGSNLGTLTVLLWANGIDSEWKERCPCGIRADTDFIELH